MGARIQRGKAPILKMAWRNIWRNTRRTVVTVGAMTLSLTMMMLWASLMAGFLTKMEKDIVEVEVGDVQVVAADYRDRPSIYTQIEEPEKLLGQLDNRGYRSSARLLGGALVASEETSAGASLRGLEIKRDADVSIVGERVEHGSWLDDDDPKGLVLGRRLAKTLNVLVGDEIVLLGQATDGSMANDLYRVRGVLGTVADYTDRGGVFMTATEFRNFFSLPYGVHQVIVRLPEQTELNVAVSEILQLSQSGQHGVLDVQSWRGLMPTMARMFDSFRQIMLLSFFVMYLAVGILILNATLMAVFERIREFGVLKAIGISPRQVLAMIVAEGAAQTGLAILLGLLLGLPALWYLQDFGIGLWTEGTSFGALAINAIWYGEISSATFIGPLSMLVIVVSLSTLYPALKAARITPVEAIHHQ